MERLSHNHADDTSELLSAYVDNALDLTERRRAEALLERCSACAQEARDLRMFKTLLRDLPTVQPPRSFTLDPTTAVGPRRLIFPTLRLATLVASMLFFVVLGVDVLYLGRMGADSSAAFSTKQAPADSSRELQFSQSSGAAPESVPAPAASAAASAAPAAAAAAPPSEVAEASAAPETMAGATLAMTDTGAAANSAPPSDEPAAQPVGGQAAGGEAADQAPPAAGGAQPSLQANDPSSPDTTRLQRSSDVEGGGATTTLRIAEIVLALIALALAGGAWWAWRQQR